MASAVVQRGVGLIWVGRLGVALRIEIEVVGAQPELDTGMAVPLAAEWL